MELLPALFVADLLGGRLAIEHRTTYAVLDRSAVCCMGVS